MEKIVVGFLGCGNIGCGVYKLLETYGAQIEENEGVGFEVRKILVRSLNKSRAWAIPSTLLTDRPEALREKLPTLRGSFYRRAGPASADGFAAGQSARVCRR